ncbi:MAG: alpha-L-rhamnosidase N-terminal domain-containing protein, partial [Gemmatimonadota bacterium]|nr:alpha-L-rhamnosidase N-terminal domain-containing protein [Gemmatimonadota bacterium]
MQNSRILFLLILLAALPALGLSSTRAVKPEISEHLLNQAWKAVWVSAPDRDRTSYGVFHFRRRFELEGKPGKFIVHISADNRYKLFVNGHEAGDGPARGDLEHWRFESYDLADRLRPGSNVIAAVVWNFDEHAPYAQMSHSTAFLVQGNSEAEEVVNTGEHWKVFENKAYSPVRITRDRIPSFHVTGPGDRVDGNSYPWGWEKPAFDDSAWEQAEPITKSRAWPRGVRDGGGYWCLVPRMIPQMEKKIEGPFIVRRGPDQFKAFLNKPWDEEPLTVPPGSKISLLLDKTHLTLAYPEFTVSGGAGSMISVTYAEAMFDDQRQKHHRDKVEGMNIIGNYDEFLPDGEAERLFTTLWVRTYRYIQLDIETADQALTIHPPASRFAAYPFEQAAVFKSDDPSLEKIWEVGWRTARLCAGETYFDCPYYEQLNYIGDTRIQALISLYVTGDDRLMRKAIMQFDDSRIPDGLTQSRYPTRIIQIIPPYSLFWIAMVYDHWMHCDDPEFVRSFLPGIRGVIEWFAGQVTENGLLGNLPWWNFVDWADEYRSGVPPGAVDGENAVISLQFVYVLQYAARLSEAFGRQCEADQYRALADRVGRAVMDR